MQKAAILIFACSAKEESRYKKLVSNAHENLALFEKLNKRVYALARSSGLPYFIFNECLQKGSTYASRLTNALTSLYDLGFEQVVVIYNNCPLLALNHIDDTIDHLKKYDLVIGPDSSGGAYLIGMNKTAFNKAAFSNLHWETNLLCNDLKYYTSSNISLSRLWVLDSVCSTRIAGIRDAVRKLPHFVRGKWQQMKGLFVKHRLFQDH